MSNPNKYPFSPFFKVKTVVFVLRWILLGFPLRSTNEAFTQFEFNPCLEYARLLLFMLIPGTCMCYIFWIYEKITKTGNPITAMNQLELGFSGLDLTVLMSLPMVTILGNTVYFFSFKKAVKGTNKILRDCTTA